jgi:hypothetical protein
MAFMDRRTIDSGQELRAAVKLHLHLSCLVTRTRKNWLKSHHSPLLPPLLIITTLLPLNLSLPYPSLSSTHPPPVHHLHSGKWRAGRKSDDDAVPSFAPSSLQNLRLRWLIHVIHFNHYFISLSLTSRHPRSISAGHQDVFRLSLIFRVKVY